ncbi:LodA/GoxA family CTQ-dependent oxidase [Halomonas sp. M4R5S39]|uniref:LodA/GoxA family CTQ-dependent oxidase n=1 Tax=Halomonas kalidii TaxID=3043293 RepID=UPI0024A826E0|nr:LodA/GoxA family CTQ-dependent oxidase [Halomonas kalidii]MDI5986449.1 LodA/GoxA family CTQ-dependent oxidase [Halomonas kalidii]
MSTFRIHPAIGFARVGNSPEYYLEPSTPAALSRGGGLPIKPGTEDETITSSDLRDAKGALKRQASRFKIYAYTDQTTERYPMGVDGTEIRIGSQIDGKTVTNIVWTVHLANKKANWYKIPESDGIDAYKDGNTPKPRNNIAPFDADINEPSHRRQLLNEPSRLRQLIIDPGPRTVQGRNAAPVAFDQSITASSYVEGAKDVKPWPDYPKSFPGDFFQLDCPNGPIDTLGELQTDQYGRLVVTGGYGRACGMLQSDGNPFPLESDIDNDGWFDDGSDGPVYAVLEFSDGSTQQVQGHAWVTATDPAYAPQTLNSVSLWDDIHDIWVRHLGLRPKLFAAGTFQDGYQPSFSDELFPIFRAAAMQMWNTNLNVTGTTAHGSVDEIQPDTDPDSTVLAGLGFIRNPNDPSQLQDSRRMPLSLGDAGESFLVLRKTQYFYLQQWNAKQYRQNGALNLNAGEQLDKAVLVNCLGGRFSPGIDLTFIVRDPALYVQDWQTSGTGPFRIQPKPLDYSRATSGQAFLSAGYTPNIQNNPLEDSSPVDTHPGSPGLEPGDASKFMALPWHTDYNSCATHQPDPVPHFSNTLYWSWPAQRPVAVYVAKDMTGSQLPKQQRFSVRGEGTKTNPFDPAQVGRFQEKIDMVRNWHKIGVVIQGSAIDAIEHGPFSAKYFLEVQSQLDDGGDPVVPWPNTVAPTTNDRFDELSSTNDRFNDL